MINNYNKINSDIVLCIASYLQLPDLERFCCVDKKIYGFFNTKIWNCIASNYGWKNETGMTSKYFLKKPLSKDTECGFFDLIGKKIFTKSGCFENFKKLNFLNFFQTQIPQGYYLEYPDHLLKQDSKNSILFYSRNGEVMGYETSVHLLWDSDRCRSWINIKRERKEISVIMDNEKIECINAPKLGALSLTFNGIEYGTLDLKHMIISVPNWDSYEEFQKDAQVIFKSYAPKDYYLEVQDFSKAYLYFFSKNGEFTYLSTPGGHCNLPPNSPEYESWIEIKKERNKVEIKIGEKEMICNLAPKITKF